jgi:hypothetical protein
VNSLEERCWVPYWKMTLFLSTACRSSKAQAMETPRGFSTYMSFFALAA